MKRIFIILPALLCLFFSCGQDSNLANKSRTDNINCIFSRDEINPVGRHIRMVQEEVFLSLPVPDSLKNKYRFNDDLVKGYLGCLSVDSVKGVYFSFIIRSENVFENYGTITKGNKISFTLKSGKIIELPFANTFSGSTNLSKEYTEYSTLSTITKENRRSFLSDELSGVRISWSNKTEEYKVLNPRIFMQQIPCVE